MRRAARRDLNEAGLVEAARKIGLKVFPINDAGIGDLIVQFGDVSEIWEVKNGPAAKLTDAQCRLRQAGLKARIVRTVDDVLAAKKAILKRVGA